MVLEHVTHFEISGVTATRRLELLEVLLANLLHFGSTLAEKSHG